MEQIEYPSDFSEFLKLLLSNNVEFLLVGGFAVAFHGYPRATADLDVWVARNRENAQRLVATLRDFGFDGPEITPELFESPETVIRMGVAPIRIEILTDIDGVEFASCRSRAASAHVAGVLIPVISLDDLRTNKRASGRPRDLDDLDHLA